MFPLWKKYAFNLTLENTMSKNQTQKVCASTNEQVNIYLDLFTCTKPKVHGLNQYVVKLAKIK